MTVRSPRSRRWSWRRRYRQLTFWRKVGFWSGLASIAGLAVGGVSLTLQLTADRGRDQGSKPPAITSALLNSLVQRALVGEAAALSQTLLTGHPPQNECVDLQSVELTTRWTLVGSVAAATEERSNTRILLRGQRQADCRYENGPMLNVELGRFRTGSEPSVRLLDGDGRSLPYGTDWDIWKGGGPGKHYWAVLTIRLPESAGVQTFEIAVEYPASRSPVDQLFGKLFLSPADFGVATLERASSCVEWPYQLGPNLAYLDEHSPLESTSIDELSVTLMKDALCIVARAPIDRTVGVVYEIQRGESWETLERIDDSLRRSIRDDVLAVSEDTSFG